MSAVGPDGLDENFFIPTRLLQPKMGVKSPRGALSVGLPGREKPIRTLRWYAHRSARWPVNSAPLSANRYIGAPRSRTSRFKTVTTCAPLNLFPTSIAKTSWLKTSITVSRRNLLPLRVDRQRSPNSRRRCAASDDSVPGVARSSSAAAAAWAARIGLLPSRAGRPRSVQRPSLPDAAGYEPDGTRNGSCSRRSHACVGATPSWDHGSMACATSSGVGNDWPPH